jgi:hypothetical protein
VLQVLTEHGLQLKTQLSDLPQVPGSLAASGVMTPAMTAATDGDGGADTGAVGDGGAVSGAVGGGHGVDGGVATEVMDPFANLDARLDKLRMK